MYLVKPGVIPTFNATLTGMLIYLSYAVRYSEIAFSSLRFWFGLVWFSICLKLVLSDNRKPQVQDPWGPFTLLFLMFWINGFRLKQRQANFCS